jgi:hypothetical protein
MKTEVVARSLYVITIGGVLTLAAAMLLVDNWPESLAAYHAMSASKTFLFWVEMAALPIGMTLVIASIWTLASMYLRGEP